jgi:hypothetical protein
MSKIDEMTMDKRLLDDFRDVFGEQVERSWEVWTEGFRATGNQQGAVYHGRFKGDTFDDALVAFKATIQDERSRNLVNLKARTFWGCRFFDNGPAAREAYG